MDDLPRARFREYCVPRGESDETFAETFLSDCGTAPGRRLGGGPGARHNT